MSTRARQIRTPRASPIDPPRLVEAGARHVASRAQIRALLKQFLGRNGFTVARFGANPSTTGAKVADLLWWAAQDPRTAQTERASVDDDQYPGD